jgi:hypothetical protein
MKFRLIIFFLLLISCVDDEDILGQCVVSPDPDAVCIEIVEPVCACNDLVYSNSCYAQKAGNRLWKSTNLESGDKCNY